MDQGTIRRGKFIYLGLPFLLLIAWLIFAPAPSINKVQIDGNLGYVADGYNFRIFNFSPEGVKTPLSFIGFNSTVKSFSIETNRAFVITKNGIVHVISIDDPLNPVKLSEFSTQGDPQAVALRGAFAFVADGPGGILIVSLEDPRRPTPIGSVLDLGFVPDIAEDGGLIYAARNGNLLDIYDFTNPSEPRLITQYNAGGIVNQISIERTNNADGTPSVKGTLLVANRAVQIVDFSNTQQPAMLNSFDFGEVLLSKAIVQGNRIYTSQLKGGVTISTIKDDGQRDELLVGNVAPRNTLDFAVLGESVFLAAGFEGLQSYNTSTLENIFPVGFRYSNFISAKVWFAVFGIALLLLWLAFFSQFVLPVRTFTQRQKIFDRLISHLLGNHGPALFVENGDVQEHSKEQLKTGPGVVWLDSASAAVTRTAVKINQTIGPGVHFIDHGEFIAGTVDLHMQFQSVGPGEKDKPFAEQTEDQDDEIYRQIQDRRKMVSALTRDGIEVIPNISVLFKVETGYPGENEPGSRFGFRTGITDESQKLEALDKASVNKAIIGQAINLNAHPDSPRRRLAWNELPASLAVDVWREYVGKFTLDELFTPSQDVPPQPQASPKPSEIEARALSQPVQVNASQGRVQDGLTAILRETNLLLSKLTKWIDKKEEKSAEQSSKTPEKPKTNSIKNKPPEKRPALQVINDMVNARLTQLEVPFLDDNGKRGEGTIESEEYKILQARGLKVQSANISKVKLHPSIDEQLKGQWSASWLNNAKAESEQIDRKRDIFEASAREQALIDYAEAMSREINEQAGKSKADVASLLKSLFLRSRALIRSGEHSEQLRRRMSVELDEIEGMIQWMEVNGK